MKKQLSSFTALLSRMRASAAVTVLALSCSALASTGIIIQSSSPELLAVDYYPIAPGNIWKYRKNGLLPIKTSALMTTERVRRVPTFVLENFGGLISGNVTNDAYGLRTHMLSFPDLAEIAVAVSFAPPITHLRASFHVGDVVNSSGRAKLLLEGVGYYPMTYSATSEVKGEQLVVVPMGILWALQVKYSYTISGKIDGETLSLAKSGSMWLVRGIGLVKEVQALMVIELVHTNLPRNDMDGFLCYNARRSRGAPKLEAFEVALTDQFGPGNFVVLGQTGICAPADRDGDGVDDPDTHFVRYRIKAPRGEPRHQRRVGIRVTNQLGEVSLNTIKPISLLVPSTKDLDSEPPAPDPDDHEVDHYKCYKVRVTRGTPVYAKGIQVKAVDQFESRFYTIKKPIRLCEPVDKNGEGIKDPGRHLLCYRVKRAPGEPRHTRHLGVHVNNPFGPTQLDTRSESRRNRYQELCVPSSIEADDAPGGSY